MKFLLAIVLIIALVNISSQQTESTATGTPNTVSSSTPEGTKQTPTVESTTATGTSTATKDSKTSTASSTTVKSTSGTGNSEQAGVTKPSEKNAGYKLGGEMSLVFLPAAFLLAKLF